MKKFDSGMMRLLDELRIARQIDHLIAKNKIHMKEMSHSNILLLRSYVKNLHLFT